MHHIVEVETEVAEIDPAWLDDIEGAVRYTLEAEGAPDALFSVALVTDTTIAELNRDFLGHEGPTDVISFELSGGPGVALAADIYLGAAQAERQAEEWGVSVREELLRLAVHGTLHVLGWDHPEGESRADSPMYQRQEELLARFLAGDR